METISKWVICWINVHILKRERRKRVQTVIKKSKVFKETEYRQSQIKGVKKKKPRKDGKYTESLDCVYYCVFFKFFDCE